MKISKKYCAINFQGLEKKMSRIKKLDLDSPSTALRLFKSNRDLGLIISLFAFLDLYLRG